MRSDTRPPAYVADQYLSHHCPISSTQKRRKSNGKTINFSNIRLLSFRSNQQALYKHGHSVGLEISSSSSGIRGYSRPKDAGYYPIVAGYCRLLSEIGLPRRKERVSR